MISNVPYPVMPPVGFRSARGLIGLGVLVCGVAMLIFGRLEYFFPLAMGYVAFGLFRAVLLGLIDRGQQSPRAGWIPGGRPGLDPNLIETVGDDAGDFLPRRRRRRSKSERSHRDLDEPSSPTNPQGPLGPDTPQ
jgi:hypothetical protein